MTYRRQLRRSGGPRKREGPRGVIRVSYARCGYCQKIDRHPIGTLDLRAWTRTTELGAVHRRCLRATAVTEEEPKGDRGSRARGSDDHVHEWTGPVRASWAPPGMNPVPVRIVGTHPRCARLVRVELGPVTVRRTVQLPEGRRVTIPTKEPGGLAWAYLPDISPADGSQLDAWSRVKLRP